VQTKKLKPEGIIIQMIMKFQVDEQSITSVRHQNIIQEDFNSSLDSSLQNYQPPASATFEDKHIPKSENKCYNQNPRGQ
jgi:hypothetical protein